MCECGHMLDAFGTHLACCLFGGQQIITHDAIRDVMYASFERVSTLYGESGCMPLFEEFHYKLIFT
jgi:hypothetical protein